MAILPLMVLAMTMTGSLRAEDDARMKDKSEVIRSKIHKRQGDDSNPCVREKQSNPNARSGVYHVETDSERQIQVYCDMVTNGGGYTFINPTYLAQMTSDDVSSMFTDTESFLFCYRKTDNSQFCGVLKQLPKYSSIDLKVGLNENEGYITPVNRNTLNLPYLYFGFLPKTSAKNRDNQGLQVNGANGVFPNCDSSPNSYIALFPNYSGRTPSSYQAGNNWPLCNKIFSSCSRRPVDLYLPNYFFMFGEFHFGGCGCYTQTNRIPNVLRVAIGFR